MASMVIRLHHCCNLLKSTSCYKISTKLNSTSTFKTNIITRTLISKNPIRYSNDKSAQLKDPVKRNDAHLTKVLKQPSQSQESTEKDILLYEQMSPDFFGKLSIFCLLQFLFFTATSFAFTGLRDAPVKNNDESGSTKDMSTSTGTLSSSINTLDTKSSTQSKDKEELPFWRKINLGENKIKRSLQALFFVLGYAVLVSGWVYIFRSVRYIVLRKDRRMITIVTYTPFAKNRHVDVLVKDINALTSRQDTSWNTTIPLQIKGALMRYKIDLRRGRFPNPVLFDSTVGRRRNL